MVVWRARRAASVPRKLELPAMKKWRQTPRAMSVARTLSLHLPTDACCAARVMVETRGIGSTRCAPARSSGTRACAAGVRASSVGAEGGSPVWSQYTTDRNRAHEFIEAGLQAHRGVPYSVGRRGFELSGWDSSGLEMAHGSQSGQPPRRWMHRLCESAARLEQALRSGTLIAGRQAAADLDHRAETHRLRRCSDIEGSDTGMRRCVDP